MLNHPIASGQIYDPRRQRQVRKARIVPELRATWRRGARDGGTEGTRGGGEQNVYDYTLNNNGTLTQYGQDPSDFKDDVLTRTTVGFINRRPHKLKPFLLWVELGWRHRTTSQRSPAPIDFKIRFACLPAGGLWPDRVPGPSRLFEEMT